MKRRSIETRSTSVSDENFNLNLFEHALKHAPSRNLILNLLASQDKNVFELFKTKSHADVVNSPVKKIKKRNHCESPTALLRRRELEKINRPDSAQSDCSERSSVSGRSSTLPFENILRGVVAYVEIKSGGNDRSGGAKALLKSMGATVCEKFSRDVTHVIFKDGSYQTYQRAKLLKVHFVSVLWLEASRRNGVRSPENNYPALGSKNYDQNISLICSQMQKDYEDVIREEIRRTLESGTTLPTTKSLTDNRRKTIASTSKRFETSSEFLNDEGSRDIEVQHILQKIRGLSQSEEPKSSSLVLGNVTPIASINNELCDLSKTIKNQLDKDSSDSFRPSSLNLECHNSDILTSDSECGMVNGDFSRSKNVVDESFDCITPYGQEALNSNMEITCSNDSDNSETKSLLSTRYISRRNSKRMNETTSMELTNLRGEETTKNETPNSVLNNLNENILNSMSHITSSSTILSGRDSKKRKINEKENCIPSSANEDEFYTLKTPKLPSKRMLKPVILSEESVENNGEDTSKEEMFVNQDSIETVMSSLKVSYSKEIRASVESERRSTEMSSLRVSSDSKKLSSGTSMSSLKLSKGSIEKSGSTNMSSLRISSENCKSKVANDAQKTNSSSQTRTQNEDKAIANGKKDEDERLTSTPFVTERKKRKYCRKSNLTEIENGDSNHNVNSEMTKNDKHTLGKSSENARSKRRETLALNKEIRKFETDLKNRTDFHDKNKEIELHFNEMNKINTIKPIEKELTKTPISSMVLLSPFVNTKSRRKRACNTVEDSNNMNRLSQVTGSKEKSEIRRLQLNEEIIDEEQLSDENGEGNWQQSEKAKSKQEGISDSRKSSENTVARDKKFPSKTTEKKINNNTSDVLNEGATFSVLGSKKAIVILENLFISPDKDKQINDKCIRRSRSGTKLRTNSCVVSSPEKNATRKNIAEEQVEVSEIKTKPGRKANFKISRSKSESDIKIEKRRSRRIRKLYNPEDAVSDEDIHKEIRVNDTEERDIIRQKKVAKDRHLTQCTSDIGNVLLTQKAMDYLEKNKNNQKELKTLFKSPETVLDQLGIDKKKEIKNKKISILHKSSDEQVELADEFVHKKSKVPSQPKKASQESRKPTRALSQKSQTTQGRNRRSTLEFEPVSLRVPKVRTKLKLNQKPTIVCTKMHRQDVQMFNQIVRKLGTFAVEDEVTSRTTHLVVGEVKRTINMLRALTRGCWILKQEWLLNSLENRKWLPEEEYEATEFSPAVQKCRLERSAFGPSYSMNIFLNCGLVYVAKSTTPRCSDLRELITICKGKITKTPDNAVICVGARFEGCKCVSEYWVLDSISVCKLKSLKKYLILETNSKSPFV